MVLAQPAVAEGDSIWVVLQAIAAIIGLLFAFLAVLFGWHGARLTYASIRLQRRMRESDRAVEAFRRNAFDPARELLVEFDDRVSMRIDEKLRPYAPPARQADSTGKVPETVVLHLGEFVIDECVLLRERLSAISIAYPAEALWSRCSDELREMEDEVTEAISTAADVAPPRSAVSRIVRNGVAAVIGMLFEHDRELHRLKQPQSAGYQPSWKSRLFPPTDD